jgi:hypothetical protein
MTTPLIMRMLAIDMRKNAESSPALRFIATTGWSAMHAELHLPRPGHKRTELF